MKIMEKNLKALFDEYAEDKVFKKLRIVPALATTSTKIRLYVESLKRCDFY